MFHIYSSLVILIFLNSCSLSDKNNTNQIIEYVQNDTLKALSTQSNDVVKKDSSLDFTEDEFANLKLNDSVQWITKYFDLQNISMKQINIEDINYQVYDILFKRKYIISLLVKDDLILSIKTNYINTKAKNVLVFKERFNSVNQYSKLCVASDYGGLLLSFCNENIYLALEEKDQKFYFDSGGEFPESIRESSTFSYIQNGVNMIW